MNKKNAEDYAKELELIKQQAQRIEREENTPEGQKRIKRGNIIIIITLILFILMIITLFFGGMFFDDKSVAGIIFIFLGIIVLLLGFYQNRVSAVTYSFLLAASGISILRGNGIEVFLLFPSIFVLGMLFKSIENSKPLIRLLRKMKPLKQVCTEKVTAVCINANEKDRLDLNKENIDVIPRFVVVTTQRRYGLRISTQMVRTLFCPIYKFDFGGMIYTLCDDYYSISKTEEGESCEILINPENPQEFYDEKRYKSDARQIFRTLHIIPTIVGIVLLIFASAVLIGNYHDLLG